MGTARARRWGLLAAVAVALVGCSTVPPRAALARPIEQPVVNPVDAAVVLPLRATLPELSPTTLPEPVEGQSPATLPEPSPTTVPEPVEGPSPDCDQLKCVALTLDDGPAPGTAKVLDLFAKRQVKATFFVLGENAVRHPRLVQRMIGEGHEVGNHSWDHPQFWYLSKKSIRAEVSRTNTALARLGVQPNLLRPPYGEWDDKVATVTRELGLSSVLWDVDPQDWKDRNPKTVAKRVLSRVRPGSIILTHDPIASTRKAYPAIIAGLHKRGYTFVTVSELLGSKLRAGKRSFHR